MKIKWIIESLLLVLFVLLVLIGISYGLVCSAKYIFSHPKQYNAYEVYYAKN